MFNQPHQAVLNRLGRQGELDWSRTSLEQPVRARYTMASTTRRRGYFGGRPPRVPRPRVLRTGTSGSISGYCASVRSEG